MLELLKNDALLLNNLDNYYQNFLKYSLYPVPSNSQVSLKEILNILSLKRREILMRELESIKEDVLYKSKIHGIYHSQKVLFWSFVLSGDNKLSEVDEKILMDASKYHDIGRTNDIDDTIHGRVSAIKVLSLIDDPIYQIKENKDLLCAIIELHSLPDQRESEIFRKYKLKDTKRFSKLWKILKDADALDRIRYDLGYLDELSFNPVYLRMPTSLNYIKASYELCTYYKEFKIKK